MTHPLTQYRDRHGLTLETFGQRIGLSKVSVWRIENGQQDLKPRLAKVVSHETGIPLWELRPDIWDAPPRNGKAA